jgi:hypothetical protein
MHSQILLGGVTHTVFSTENVPYNMDGYVREPTHVFWKGIGTKTGDVEWRLIRDADMFVEDVYELYEGSTYTFKADRIHTTLPAVEGELACTLMTKTRTYPGIDPIIVSPYRDTYTNGLMEAEGVTDAYDGLGAPSYSDMADIVHEVVSLLKSDRG